MEKQESIVPVYLPDRTIVGRATITKDERGMIATIRLGDSVISELMSENLIGMSIVYQTNEARDAVDVSVIEQVELDATKDCDAPQCVTSTYHWHGVLCSWHCECRETQE